MIINGYDTTVGSRFKVKDKATETIRMLQSSDKLELVDQRGVYAISHKNDYTRRIYFRQKPYRYNIR